MQVVGFDPTPPGRPVPETSALDHSATLADIYIIERKLYTFFIQYTIYKIYNIQYIIYKIYNNINNNDTRLNIYKIYGDTFAFHLLVYNVST